MTVKTFPLRWVKLWLSIGWLLVALVVYLSLERTPPNIEVHVSDKLTHLFAYAVLMLWFVQIYEPGRMRVRVALGLIALGVCLEFLQGYTGYRSFEVADMLANTAGVLLGWAAAPPRTANVLQHVERAVAR